MGTWGTEPRDSDTAGDWHDEISDRIHCFTEGEFFRRLGKIRTGNSSDLYHLVGAMQKLSDDGVFLTVNVLRKCAEILYQVVADQKFASQWNNPRKFVASATEYRRQLIYKADELEREYGAPRDCPLSL